MSREVIMRDELACKEIVLQKTRAIMPDVIQDLKGLIRFPSVAFPGYPKEPVLAMADATVTLLRRYGLPDARLIEVPGGYLLCMAKYHLLRESLQSSCTPITMSSQPKRRMDGKQIPGNLWKKEDVCTGGELPTTNQVL